MTDGMLNSCKTALSTLIGSDKVQDADNPLEAFAEGLSNFVSHYCHDQHESPYCYHPNVKNAIYTYRVLKKKSLLLIY